MLTPTDFDPPKSVHHLTLIFASSGLFIENNERFLHNFAMITYQVKLNYSLRTPHVFKYQRCKQLLWCRHVIVYLQNVLIHQLRYLK